MDLSQEDVISLSPPAPGTNQVHIPTMLSQELLPRLRLPSVEDVGQYLRSLSVPTLVGMGVLAATTTYYLATRPKALPPPCDLCAQSREIKTMYESFLRGVRVSNNGPCLGSRKAKQPYEWLTYRQVLERAENLGSAFLHRGHSQSTDPHIGIFAQNRPEWTMTELACYTYSLVSVPLYDTLGDKEHTVKTIVLMEAASSELVSRGQHAGIQILSLQEMEAIGAANHQRPIPPRPEDMAIICFTSGTTGNPKGAMLTHRNLVSNCSAFISITNAYGQTTPGDVMMSYLPLAHMFERMVEGLMLVHGAKIGYFQGDIRLLMDDLVALKPTVFPVVPRLLNRMFDKIYGQANTSLKRWILGFAYRRKEAELMRGIIRRDSIWDMLIFRKVQNSLGGHVRLMITGAAPVSPTVLTFLRAALGCQFYEGYGQTECTAGCTLSMPGDFSAGHVGAPLPCNSIKLVDVAEMNYLASNGEGECGTLKIVDRKKNIFKLAQGEYIAPEKIENVYIRSDALAQVFVHGDSLQIYGQANTSLKRWILGFAYRRKEAELMRGIIRRDSIWDMLIFRKVQCGTLKIVDRKKNIFKLAQGEYIAPEKIENVYIRSDALAQVFVHGDSLQKSLGLEGSYLELCGMQVKAICVHTELFSIQNGLLTPTLKAKRVELQRQFRSQLDQLYAGINM
ncbi:hypothetical protein CRUP_020112 [Coryphaenoides rupestris]|nr:hypothetical protein CRUP_020112 [Coryphaenoides rupestris]